MKKYTIMVMRKEIILLDNEKQEATSTLEGEIGQANSYHIPYEVARMKSTSCIQMYETDMDFEARVRFLFNDTIANAILSESIMDFYVYYNIENTILKILGHYNFL